jgi:hypothetical protein
VLDAVRDWMIECGAEQGKTAGSHSEQRKI